MWKYHRSGRGSETSETATFAAGCFWGVEAAFRALDGVFETSVGFSGGSVPDPTYGEVCTGKTGHAESVRVVFDPRAISYESLLEEFWSVHDPCTLNRQGPDIGTQYRSAIFYHSETQRSLAQESKALLEVSGRCGTRKVVTEILPAGPFYKAEEYHQRYLEKRGSGSCGT
ncbi:TPA: peptide-methionine (S)-S-oxide reductase MsrA [Thermoplasmata archaeon]|nr:peptide-methionine (S)-S-oxide reductase MsrA [Thermoplasmata archaeon]